MSPDGMIAILVLLIGAVILWANSIQNLLKDQIKSLEKRVKELERRPAQIVKEVSESKRGVHYNP